MPTRHEQTFGKLKTKKMALQKNIQTSVATPIVKTPVIQLAPQQAMGAQALGAAIAAAIGKPQSDGVIDLGAGETINAFPIPKTLVATLKSKHADGAVAKTCYLFNENFYNQTPTDNGSGANSIVRTYNDGFVGKSYERLFASVNNGLGLKVYGFNIQCKDGAGNDDADQLAAVNMSLLVYDGYGNGTPNPIDFSDALRNTAFKDGLLTIKFPMMINALSQLKVTLLGDTVTDHNITFSLRTTPYPEDAK